MFKSKSDTQRDLPEPDAAIQRRYRIGVAAVLLTAVACVIAVNSLYRAVNTIRYLDAVESSRDQWQRPSDVIAALNLTEGKRVADIGCGAGYFALKLSRRVGPAGRVLAVDILKLPLAFLGTRALLRGEFNVRVHIGDPDDPHLPAGMVDAVLVANLS